MKPSLTRVFQRRQLTGVLVGLLLLAAINLFCFFAQSAPVGLVVLLNVVFFGCISLILLYDHRLFRQILSDLSLLSLFRACDKTASFAFAETANLAVQKSQLLSNYPWGYLIADSQGVCLELSERGAAILGRTPEQLVGKALSAEEFPLTIQALTQQTPLEGERTIQRENGSCTLYCSVFPFQLCFGEVGVMSTFVDISETKALIAKIHQMDRLCMVGEMVSIITHDIRNPLASIKGLAQLGELTPERAEQLGLYRRIDAMVNDVNQYLEQILCYSRPDRDEAGSHWSIRSLFENIVLMLQGKMTSTGIKLQVEVSEPEPQLAMNRLELQHVLLNLINNAFEAMSAAEIKGVITLRAWQEAETALIEVSDEGPGIPPENISRIWNIFYTTKPNGSGIGLAMAKRSIEQHQGTIGVVSSPEGTTFTIKLPARQAADISG